jgi:preprotein translocase subunit SecY
MTLIVAMVNQFRALFIVMDLVNFAMQIGPAIVQMVQTKAENLAKMAYNIPGIRQGNQTTQYLKQTISRLAFMGGVFLAFLAFFPVILGNAFQFNIFKNVTSLLILIGVITDTTAQIRGYLISRNYEGFKKV